MSRDNFATCDNPNCTTAVPLGAEDSLPHNWWLVSFQPADNESDEMPTLECCTQRCLAEAVGAFDWPNYVGA